MAKLLNVDDALEQILASIEPLAAEAVAVDATLDRVLAADIHSDIDLPPFDNSAMDGYAVRAADTANASADKPVHLRVTMDIPAGTAADQTLQAGEAARIMTGAPIPAGADAVVPVEATDSDWSKGTTAPLRERVAIYESAQHHDNIRPKGQNVRIGETILKAGTVLRPQDTGMLVALGRAQVPVVRRPRVAILSTGDELVDVDQPLTPGKIRNTNTYTLAGLVSQEGGIPLRLPVAGDTLEAVRALFQEALALDADMIISSAGVSVGAADLVRTVLDELGEVGFWRINLRPGKPLAYGSLRGVPFFGLPGNPVSTMVTFDVLVRPALLKLGGRVDIAPHTTAIAGEAMKSDGRRSYLRVKLTHEDGRLVARTTGTQSSSALMSMVLADGLLVIPAGTRHVAPGTELQVRLLRQI